jgi:hypothetical protein
MHSVKLLARQACSCLHGTVCNDTVILGVQIATHFVTLGFFCLLLPLVIITPEVDTHFPCPHSLARPAEPWLIDVAWPLPVPALG